MFDEYRRFAFLAATAGHPVTPSDAVDQAWHLHLTYSRDYWDRFCPLLGNLVSTLVSLLAITLVIGLARLVVDRRTQAGIAAIRLARRHARRLRLAPTRPEMPLAVAMFGTVVLAGSALEPLYYLRCASNRGSIDASSGDSGCGGGGCGGCGG